MIKSNWENYEGLVIEGSISKVSAECVMIIRQIYKRNKELYGQEIALGILTNMMLKAIDEKNEVKQKIEWNVSEEEKMEYTE